jgi:UDP-2-acetamido-3-amino-2,3-dideoxy-glucuronate N-acetyltransferase
MSQPFIHPTAAVEVGAHVGDGSRIWHGSHVRSGAHIGHNCVVGFSVFIDEGVVVGARCKIQNHVSIYKGVRLGDDVFVGPGAMFTNDRLPRMTVCDWSLEETRVESGASIGANATVICGVVIGAGALVGAGAVVTNDVGHHEVALGVPARRIGWICDCGARSNSQPVATCVDCGSGAWLNR